MSSNVPQDYRPDANEASRSVTEKGFYVFPNVFSDAEIKTLRKAAAQHFRSGGGRSVESGGLKQVNAAVEVPSIGWLFSHPGLLACERKALGSDSIMYTNHASLQKNVFGGWHKDDGTDGSAANYGYFTRFAYDQDDCRVLTTAIYLEDHDRDAAGLWVREGSHHTRSLDEGTVHYLGARAGSVVIFDVRITHSGEFKSNWQARLSRHVRLPYFDAVFAGIRKAYRSVVGRDRHGIFFTFGLPNEYTINFAKYAMVKQLSFVQGSQPRLPTAVRKPLDAANVQLAEDHVWAPKAEVKSG